jgi:hypothetical protein
MKGTFLKIPILVLLSLFLIALTGGNAGPRRYSHWVGRWRTSDSPGDESINTLAVAYISDQDLYRLTWEETYFTLCDGEPGIGRGIGQETVDGLEVEFDFYCQEELSLSLVMPFGYNSESDTITSYGSTLIQTWGRIPLRVSGK